jgi:hypothetical protein
MNEIIDVLRVSIQKQYNANELDERNASIERNATNPKEEYSIWNESYRIGKFR